MFVGVCMSNINGICRHYPELHQRPQIWPPAWREDTGSLNSTFITSLPPHVLDTSVLKFVSETSFIKTSQRIFSANWGSLQGVIWLGWQISGIMAVGELQPQLEAGLWLWWWVARWAVVGAGDRGEAGHFGQWLERGITGDGGTPDCALLIAAYTHYIILIAGCGDHPPVSGDNPVTSVRGRTLVGEGDPDSDIIKCESTPTLLFAII